MRSSWDISRVSCPYETVIVVIIIITTTIIMAWKKWIGGTPSEHPPYSPDLAPMRFLGFSNREKGAPRQEISK
jgi:hypothetical protein